MRKWVENCGFGRPTENWGVLGLRTEEGAVGVLRVLGLRVLGDVCVGGKAKHGMEGGREYQGGRNVPSHGSNGAQVDWICGEGHRRTDQHLCC